MDTGMLWFDDSDRSVEDKVKRAAAYYIEKYERQPNLCVVHPSMVEEKDGIEVGQIAVKPASAIMPHHYWIGVHQAAVKAQTKATRKAA